MNKIYEKRLATLAEVERSTRTFLDGLRAEFNAKVANPHFYIGTEPNSVCFAYFTEFSVYPNVVGITPVSFALRETNLTVEQARELATFILNTCDTIESLGKEAE